jgi:hypothetical protein
MVDVDHNCIPFSTCLPSIGGNVALLNVLPEGGGGWGGGWGVKGFPPISNPSPQPSYMSACFHIIAAFQCYNLQKLGHI